MVPFGCGSQLRGHDKRSLVLADGCLQIFDPSSTGSVKRVVDLRREIDECKLLPGGLLALSVLRESSAESGVTEFKKYIFDFSEPPLAEIFYNNIRHFADLCGLDA